ncbi:MAG TPA: carboxymuconolactone decarboxylase family protein [Gemmatimonadaceae bacterium]|nr:carboxymuconolactone decarboxylase family protein [Gemmatimonadaceae bacterium]
MTPAEAQGAIVSAMDGPTLALVRLSAVLTAGDEPSVRAALEAGAREIPAEWIEELILQSYLFAGFPRALNGMREWRRVSGRPAPDYDDDGEALEHAGDWASRGEETCAHVYGPFYEKLRHNIRHLHPALDAWMIMDGYGKVLGRPGLSLVRRELCIVAACIAGRQDRQLHSHLHGVLHVGGTREDLDATLDALAGVVHPDALHSARLLWARVKGK